MVKLQEIENAASFIDILKKNGINRESESLWVSACCCLAKRKVAPANLSQKSLNFLTRFESQFQFDSSPLSLSIGVYLNELETDFDSKLTIDFESLFKIISFDCLLPAWTAQLLRQDKETYSRARLSRSYEELGRLTQWFTPSWIASHLAREVISSRTDYFFDPACGAGHILVEALKILCIEHSISPAECLKQIIGVDIDSDLLKLSALSLYLCALDLNKESVPDKELNIPALYALEQKKELGSLLLAVDGHEKLNLVRYDGQSFPSTCLPGSYKSIAANPPYLGYRLMPKDLVAFLRSNYSGSHYDLYAAFLELGTRLLDDGGKLSFMCQQSFLSITRYENLRRKLLENFQFNSVVTLGSGAFETRSGEKVSSVIVTLTRSQNKDYPLAHADLRRTVQKNLARKNGINTLAANNVNGMQLISASKLISGTPILPDCPFEIASLLGNLPALGDAESGVVATNGLFTCDNKRFVKHYAQINETEKHLYVPYDKGGGQKWFASSPYLLWWQDQGESIRNLRVERGQSRSLPGEEYYFKPGITYSYIGTRGFKARLLSPGSVFDIASSSLFCRPQSGISMHYLLGFLNSSLVVFILGQLNPTVNFQIGDIRRIPFKIADKDLAQEVSSLVKDAIVIAANYDSLNPDSPTFNLEQSRLLDCSIEDYVNQLNKSERLLQEKINALIYELYAVSPETRRLIEENYWVKNSNQAAFKPLQTSSTRLASAAGSRG